jgi:RecJ-like exonuclease
LSNDYNSYEASCKSCNKTGIVKICPDCGGLGKFVNDGTKEIGDATYDAELIYSFRVFKNCLISPGVGERDPAHIKFDGGYGLLAPLKTS